MMSRRVSDGVVVYAVRSVRQTQAERARRCEAPRSVLTGGPVENVDMDRLDTLATLLELTNRYGVTRASALSTVISEAKRHRLEFGHDLAHGCCRRDDPSAAAPSSRRAA
jgi:hypothetical protein